MWSTTTRTRVGDATAVTFCVKCFKPLKLYPLSGNIFRKWCASYFYFIFADSAEAADCCSWRLNKHGETLGFRSRFVAGRRPPLRSFNNHSSLAHSSFFHFVTRVVKLNLFTSRSRPPGATSGRKLGWDAHCPP